MVVLYKGYNNHSNRLLQAIHLEAFCLENGLRFYNPSFWRMSSLYGVRSNHLDIIVWFFLCFLNKFRLLKRLKFTDVEQQGFYEDTLRRKNLVFVQGWCFRNYDLTSKYQDRLVAKYALLPKFYERNDLYNQVVSLDRNACNLVGVHIRGGDYRTWRKGEFFFTNDVYQKSMNNLDVELDKITGKKTLFIIFSNEVVHLNKSENIIISTNPWYIDQQIMSLCDYLIGPPSTFTLWASYIGKAKYFHIKDDSGKITLEDFVRFKG